MKRIDFTGRYRRDFQRHIMDTPLEAEVETVIVQLVAEGPWLRNTATTRSKVGGKAAATAMFAAIWF